MKKRKKLLEKLIVQLEDMKNGYCSDTYDVGYDCGISNAITLLQDEIDKIEAVE